MKKIRIFMEKPMTNGSYLLVVLLCYACAHPDDWLGPAVDKLKSIWSKISNATRKHYSTVNEES